MEAYAAIHVTAPGGQAAFLQSSGIQAPMILRFPLTTTVLVASQSVGRERNPEKGMHSF